MYLSLSSCICVICVLFLYPSASQSTIQSTKYKSRMRRKESTSKIQINQSSISYSAIQPTRFFLFEFSLDTIFTQTHNHKKKCEFISKEIIQLNDDGGGCFLVVLRMDEERERKMKKKPNNKQEKPSLFLSVHQFTSTLCATFFWQFESSVSLIQHLLMIKRFKFPLSPLLDWNIQCSIVFVCVCVCCLYNEMKWNNPSRKRYYFGYNE